MVTNSWYTGVLAGCRAKHSDRTPVNLCHNLRKNASRPYRGIRQNASPDTLDYQLLVTAPAQAGFVHVAGPFRVRASRV